MTYPDVPAVLDAALARADDSVPTAVQVRPDGQFGVVSLWPEKTNVCVELIPAAACELARQLQCAAGDAEAGVITGCPAILISPAQPEAG